MNNLPFLKERGLKGGNAKRKMNHICSCFHLLGFKSSVFHVFLSHDGKGGDSRQR